LQIGLEPARGLLDLARSLSTGRPRSAYLRCSGRQQSRALSTALGRSYARHRYRSYTAVTNRNVGRRCIKLPPPELASEAFYGRPTLRGHASYLGVAGDIRARQGTSRAIEFDGAFSGFCYLLDHIPADTSPSYSVRPNGAVHQWRKDPPRKLSVGPGS
jgi:hypothetical protein